MEPSGAPGLGPRGPRDAWKATRGNLMPLAHLRNLVRKMALFFTQNKTK